MELKQGTWERTVKQHGNEQDGFWTEQFWKCSTCGYERRDVFIPKHKPNQLRLTLMIMVFMCLLDMTIDVMSS